MKSIRVLLADDHKLIRAGLRLVIEQQPDLRVSGEADDGRQAVELPESLKPCCAMDIGMPNLNGIESARQITQAHPDAAVAMSACIPMKVTCCGRSGPALALTC